jgi:hypothetical protein
MCKFLRLSNEYELLPGFQAEENIKNAYAFRSG